MKNALVFWLGIVISAFSVQTGHALEIESPRLVQYFYAQQSGTGSYFEIFRDGKIAHEERTASPERFGPIKIEVIRHDDLSQADLDWLEGLSASLWRRDVRFGTGAYQTRNSFYGRFEVRNGFNLFKIVEIERPFIVGGRDRVKFGYSAEAREIHKFLGQFGIRHFMKMPTSN